MSDIPNPLFGIVIYHLILSILIICSGINEKGFDDGAKGMHVVPCPSYITILLVRAPYSQFEGSITSPLIVRDTS